MSGDTLRYYGHRLTDVRRSGLQVEIGSDAAPEAFAGLALETLGLAHLAVVDLLAPVADRAAVEEPARHLVLTVPCEAALPHYVLLLNTVLV